MEMIRNNCIEYNHTDEFISMKYKNQHVTNSNLIDWGINITST